MSVARASPLWGWDKSGVPSKEGFEVTALDIFEKAVLYGRDKACEAEVNINFVVGIFLNLPFKNAEFDFTFDFGCLHYVEVKDRTTFIMGVYRVLNSKSMYLLVCFSYRNGLAWNHSTMEQILGLFQDCFEIKWIKHVSSIEGDKVRRYFYEVMMEKING